MMRKARVIVALALSAVLAYSIVSAVPSLAGPPDIPTIDVNVVNEQNNPVAVFDVDTPSFKSFRVISDFEPFSTGSTSFGIEMTDPVPEGRRLKITYASYQPPYPR